MPVYRLRTVRVIAMASVAAFDAGALPAAIGSAPRTDENTLAWKFRPAGMEIAAK